MLIEFDLMLVFSDTMQRKAFSGFYATGSFLFLSRIIQESSMSADRDAIVLRRGVSMQEIILTIGLIVTFSIVCGSLFVQTVMEMLELYFNDTRQEETDR